MAQKNEENVVDQFLVDKISKAIDVLDEPKNLMAAPYSFKTEFGNVLGFLRRTRNPRYKEDEWLGIRRGNLYTLNNLVTECHQITKIQASSSHKDVYDARDNIKKSKAIDNIKKSLRKIKKEASPNKESSSKGTDDGSVRSEVDQEQSNIKKSLRKIKEASPSKESSSIGADDESVRSELDQEQSVHKAFTKHTQEMYRWSSRHEPRKVHGIEHRVLTAVRELVMQNTDAPFKVFGVVGAPGIGKTTFCQSLFGNKFVKEHFSPRIWVCLSKRKEDVKKSYKEEIVVRILHGLGIEDEVIDNAKETGLRKLILLLRLQLIGKRYLIVLDDAWNDDKFFYNLTGKGRFDENLGKDLAYGLTKGYGGAVISSSRSKELLQKMFGENVSLEHMEPLKHEIIYEIFKDAVIGYDDDEMEFPKDELDQIKEELLKRCDGVPLAAILLAKIARENLDVKPKLKGPKPQQTPTGGGESSRDVRKAPTGGHE